MGSSEEIKETETENQNQIFNPNLVAKQIIGDVEVNNEQIKQKNNSDTSSLNKNNNKNHLIIKKNMNMDNTNISNDEINKKNEVPKNIKKLGSQIFSDINKGQYFNKDNLFISQTAEAIKMEITNQKKDIDYRKFKFNGITVVQNLRDYIPTTITRDEIKDMVFNAFGDGLVDDYKYYIPRKTVTRKQANEIVNLIESFIKEDSIVNNLENDSILNGVNLKIDLVDLNEDIIKEKMFKGKNPSNEELENTMKNLSRGLSNTKILSIDFE